MLQRRVNSGRVSRSVTTYRSRPQAGHVGSVVRSIHKHSPQRFRLTSSPLTTTSSRILPWRLLPPGPESLRNNPEDLVEDAESGSGTPTLEHRELLPKGQVFKPKPPTRAGKANNRGQKESDSV